jgi:hypothetical protein
MMRKLAMLVGVLAMSQAVACSRCSRDVNEAPSMTAPAAAADPDARTDVVRVRGTEAPEIEGADAAVAKVTPSPFLEGSDDSEALEPRDVPGSAADTIRPRASGAVWPPEGGEEIEIDVEDDPNAKDEAKDKNADSDTTPNGAQDGADDDDAPAPEPLPTENRDAGAPDAMNPYEDSPVEPGRVLDAGLPNPT